MHGRAFFLSAIETCGPGPLATGAGIVKWHDLQQSEAGLGLKIYAAVHQFY